MVKTFIKQERLWQLPDLDQQGKSVHKLKEHARGNKGKVKQKEEVCLGDSRTNVARSVLS